MSSNVLGFAGSVTKIRLNPVVGSGQNIVFVTMLPGQGITVLDEVCLAPLASVTVKVTVKGPEDV